METKKRDTLAELENCKGATLKNNTQCFLPQHHNQMMPGERRDQSGVLRDRTCPICGVAITCADSKPPSWASHALPPQVAPQSSSTRAGIALRSPIGQSFSDCKLGLGGSWSNFRWFTLHLAQPSLKLWEDGILEKVRVRWLFWLDAVDIQPLSLHPTSCPFTGLGCFLFGF